MNPLSMAHVIIDRHSNTDLLRKTLSYAEKFGLGVVFDMPEERYKEEKLDHSSTAQMLKAGTPAFTVEVPGVFYSPSEGESLVYNGLWNMVYALGMIGNYAGVFWEHPSKKILGIGLYAYHYPGPSIEHAGFFRRAVEPGDWVYDGKILGTVFNSAGEIVEAVKADTSGYVADIMDRSIVSTGERPFILFVPEKNRPIF